jgi:hypothetical protein
MKINKKNISVQKFLRLSEAEIQGLLHPAEANLGYFLAWFQSPQLPSTQSESPLAPNSHVSFNVRVYSTADRIFHIKVNCTLAPSCVQSSRNMSQIHSKPSLWTRHGREDTYGIVDGEIFSKVENNTTYYDRCRRNSFWLCRVDAAGL